MNLRILILILGLGTTFVHADDFYSIVGCRFEREASSDDPGLLRNVESVNSSNQKVTTQVFVPSLKVRLQVKDNFKSSTVFPHVYFYDSSKTLVATDKGPSATDGSMGPFSWPVILSKDSTQTVYFEVPESVQQTDDWSAVVVFGDNLGVDAQVYQGSEGYQVEDYEFPEKSRVEDKGGPPIVRKSAMDPLLEHVVATDNPDQPQITLFLRPPLGMTDASTAKGVLCLSLLAGSLDEVRRELQGFEPGQDVNGILKFAQDHQLIIICWGSRGLWDPHKSWDDLDPDTAWKTDKAFDQVANAWANGVQYFIKEYGIPQNGYLLWGMSGSAQYACRLALRKPEYFLAVDVHIPSSFDKPTVDGNKILWCLTTGELEPGYQRSLRFYRQCRALGYPMVYKAIEGLGHAGSPIADDIGSKFFEYALAMRDKRSAYDQAITDPLQQFQMAQGDPDNIQPWPDSFRTPPFVGDMVNQAMVPYGRREMVPPGFRVPLPTQAIAEAWNQ